MTGACSNVDSPQKNNNKKNKSMFLANVRKSIKKSIPTLISNTYIEKKFMLFLKEES